MESPGKQHPDAVELTAGGFECEGPLEKTFWNSSREEEGNNTQISGGIEDDLSFQQAFALMDFQEPEIGPDFISNMLHDKSQELEQEERSPQTSEVNKSEIKSEGAASAIGSQETTSFISGILQDEGQEVERANEGHQISEMNEFEGVPGPVGCQEPKIGPGFISDMLQDGSLSVEGLASKGFMFLEDRIKANMLHDKSQELEQEERSPQTSEVNKSEINSEGAPSVIGSQETTSFISGILQDEGQEFERANEGHQISETNEFEGVPGPVGCQEPKIGPGFISDMLQDGSLSVEGLASKGFMFLEDSESESDNDGEDDQNNDSSEDESDEESEEVSVADSEEEDEMPNKGKARTGQKKVGETKDGEEAEPPRTKHELNVLPPVPKVTAVLEPHHITVSVGYISSVLDVSVIVEATTDSKVLSENSIIWLTERRVPLGLIDEVFGPVKKPFYLVRFNEISDIPEGTKMGLDVSYVSEFSEFVLKDNPSLHKRAIDASGIDDEELGSDEDLEFSDDEKEAEARLREKSKRALDSQGNGLSRDWNGAEGQPPHPKGQRKNRGRGHGRGAVKAPAMSNAVDYAADDAPGIDLRCSPQYPSWSGSKQQNGRGRGRGYSGRQTSDKPQHRGSGRGPGHGFRSFPNPRESPQRVEVPHLTEQGHMQMHPRIASQQGHQAFHAEPIPAHLQGSGIHVPQGSSGFQPFAFNNLPGYGSQLATDGHGNFYPVIGGPQIIRNPVVFNTPSLQLDPQFSNQGQAPLNYTFSPGSNVYPVHMNNALYHSLGNRQAGEYSFNGGLTSPAPAFGAGMVVPNYRFQSMPQNSQNVGPVVAGRLSHTGGRGIPPGHQRRLSPNGGLWQG